MKRLCVLFVLVLYGLSSFPLFAQIPLTNISFVKEVRFNFGGLQDQFFGLLPNGDYLMVNGAKQVYDPPAPQSLEAAVGKFTMDGQTEWVVIDSGFNGADYSSSQMEQMTTIDNKTILAVADLIPNCCYVSLLLKLDENGNTLLKKTYTTENYLIFITHWADTIVVVEQRKNGDIVLLDENFNLIRKFPVQGNCINRTTPRVKGDILWLSSGDAMFGTYVAQYNLRTGQQNWRFNTPDTDTLRSFISMIELDTVGNVYCVGNKLSYTNQNFFAYSLDPSGNLRWYQEWFPAGDWRLNMGNWAQCAAVSNNGLLAVGGSVERYRQPVDPNEYDAYLALFKIDDGQFLEEYLWNYETGSRFSANMDAVFLDNKLILLGYAGNGPQNTWTWGYLRFYDVITSVDQISSEIPSNFALSQNYPNPFNPTTSIKYQVSSIQYVKIQIFDILGREIATLVDGEKHPGTYEVNFNASNLPSGTYFYRLTTKDFVETRKMILLK